MTQLSFLSLVCRSLNSNLSWFLTAYSMSASYRLTRSYTPNRFLVGLPSVSADSSRDRLDGLAFPKVRPGSNYRSWCRVLSGFMGHLASAGHRITGHRTQHALLVDLFLPLLLPDRHASLHRCFSLQHETRVLSAFFAPERLFDRLNGHIQPPRVSDAQEVFWYAVYAAALWIRLSHSSRSSRGESLKSYKTSRSVEIQRVLNLSGLVP